MTMLPISRWEVCLTHDDVDLGPSGEFACALRPLPGRYFWPVHQSWLGRTPRSSYSTVTQSRAQTSLQADESRTSMFRGVAHSRNIKITLSLPHRRPRPSRRHERPVPPARPTAPPSASRLCYSQNSSNEGPVFDMRRLGVGEKGMGYSKFVTKFPRHT
jgi:hypothetical protein